MSDVLLWVDCEMTGLDVEKEELCEIALVPTDFSLQPLDCGRDFVIKPSKRAIENIKNTQKEKILDDDSPLCYNEYRKQKGSAYNGKSKVPDYNQE